jgi:hypothetical protein
MPINISDQQRLSAALAISGLRKLLIELVNVPMTSVGGPWNRRKRSSGDSGLLTI